MELTPAQWLALVAERAADLRKAGVRKLSMPQLQIELDPYDGPAESPSHLVNDGEIEMTSPPVDDSDPLNDPTLYGRRDGSVPGFRRNRHEDE